jgi:hypothetical protein
MDLRHGRRLRRIGRLLCLIGRQRSRDGLLVQSIETDAQGPLPLHLRAFVRYGGRLS